MQDDNSEQNESTTTRKRLRLPTGYAVLAEIIIEPADWFRFERLAENTPETCIIAHDDPVGGWMREITAEIRLHLRKYPINPPFLAECPAFQLVTKLPLADDLADYARSKPPRSSPTKTARFVQEPQSDPGVQNR